MAQRVPNANPTAAAYGPSFGAAKGVHRFFVSIKEKYLKPFTRLLAVLGAVALTTLSAATVAAPASADPANCKTWPWPNPNVEGRQRGIVSLAPATYVTLRTGYLNGQTVGWAEIHGYSPSDQVWMDVSSTGGNGWIQCGPWHATTSTRSKAHTVDPNNDNLVFRACGKAYGGVSKCTPWW